MALTTLERARDWLGITVATYDAMLQRLIDACSDTIERFCNCKFTTQTLAERFDGTGDEWLYLSARPLTAVTRVSIGTASAVSLTNADTTADGATASISSTTLALTIHGGTNAGTSSLTLTDHADVDALVTAINALGTGWAAVALSSIYGSWDTADLGKYDFMGQECFGDTIYLELPYEREGGFEVYADEGCLFRAGGWPRGHRNIYVDYTAGYTTVPDDLEQIALDLVKRVYDGRERDAGLTSERLGDYAWTAADVAKSLDDSLLRRLAQWRWVSIGA